MTILKKEAVVTEASIRVSGSFGCTWWHLALTSIQESKIGLAVGKLRNHAAKEVSELAKELVKKWKNEVDRAKAAGHGSGAAAKKDTGSADGKAARELCFLS